MMQTKLEKFQCDDLNYWNVRQSLNDNDIENLYDEEPSLALSVSLLLKNRNISQTNPVRLPTHRVPIENCRCHRSFHIFCTDLLPKNEQDIDMIYIHPAPRNHDRDLSRRAATPLRKSYRKHHEENDQDTNSTTRSELSQEYQLFEKKPRFPPKIPPRTTSLNLLASHQSSQRSSQASINVKYSLSSRVPKPPLPTAQLQVRALSVFDESPTASQVFVPRGPPPSPKTPTLESSVVSSQHSTTAPFRAFAISPRVRNSNNNGRKYTKKYSLKNVNYEDHAREYLSASDCSDNEKDKDNNNDNDNDNNDDDNNDDDNNNNNGDDDDEKDQNQLLTITKPKLPIRNKSIARSGTSLRDRLMTHNANRYLGLAEVYYSPYDVYKHLTEKSRRPFRSQTRLLATTNESDDALTITSKTTTITKTVPMPQSKSVFGFSKTASSMHFGHAAGRLGLQASFEKWPQPLSRRTPIGRKQEVTALRLVTLPLVTS